MINYTEKENIIKRMVESIIMPKYPEIEEVGVTSQFFRGVREYNVTLYGSYYKKYGVNSPMKIINEIETLFKIASLNTQTPAGPRDYVNVYFS
jgi:hypothetical protein